MAKGIELLFASQDLSQQNAESAVILRDEFASPRVFCPLKVSVKIAQAQTKQLYICSTLSRRQEMQQQLWLWTHQDSDRVIAMRILPTWFCPYGLHFASCELNVDREQACSDWETVRFLEICQ